MLKNIARIMVVTVAVFAGLPGPAGAALPAPGWMPGSPLMAGPQIVLLWTPVAGAAKYNIYLNGKKVAESVSIQAIIPAPEESGKHEIVIAAVDASGQEGGKSAPGMVSIFKLVPPKGINGRLIGKNVGLVWEQVPGGILYNVYRSTQADKGYQLADSVQDVRWTDSKTEEGKKYFYKVSVKDASGKESEMSAPFPVEVVTAAAKGAEVLNVTGLRTKKIFEVTKGEITELGPVKIDEPYDIALSPDKKKLYVSSVNARNISAFSVPDGDYLGKFGDGDSKEAGNFTTVQGFTVARNGDLYVADGTNRAIVVLQPDGKYKETIIKVERLDWMREEPRIQDVDVDEGGTVYVLDYINGAVLVYGPDRKLRKHFALFGKEDDKTGYLTYIKVSGGFIYVADGAKGRVLKLNADGKIVGKAGTLAQQVGGLQFLTGFDVAPGGLVYLVDRGTNLVQVYNIDTGKYQYTLANHDNTRPAELFTPKAVAVDAQEKRAYFVQGIVNQVKGLQMFGEPEVAKGN